MPRLLVPCWHLAGADVRLNHASIAAIRLAVLLPTADSWPELTSSAGAISLAVADANEKFPVKLSYVWEQVGCDGTQAMAAMGRMMQAGIVDAVIGPDCEASCEPSAALTAGHNIAQISYGCSSDLLSDKKAYPTVAPNHDSRSPLLPPPTTGCPLCARVGIAACEPFQLSVVLELLLQQCSVLETFPSPSFLPAISECTNLGCSSSAR